MYFAGKAVSKVFANPGSPSLTVVSRAPLQATVLQMVWGARQSVLLEPVSTLH